ncbi:hypothetical protein [Alcaligenes sp. CHO6]
MHTGIMLRQARRDAQHMTSCQFGERVIGVQLGHCLVDGLRPRSYTWLG